MLALIKTNGATHIAIHIPSNDSCSESKSAPEEATSHGLGDLEKLARSVNDALSGVLFNKEKFEDSIKRLRNEIETQRFTIKSLEKQCEDTVEDSSEPESN